MTCSEYSCTAPATKLVAGVPVCDEHAPLFYEAALRLEELRRPPRRRGRVE